MNPVDTSPASIAALKRQLHSPDPDTSALALAGLIRLGWLATPVFLEALSAPVARTRRLAAEGLGSVQDPSSADALFQATQDVNDEVRALAAAALYRLGDPRGLAALVATINDYPDLLHSPYTVSVHTLIRGDKVVLPFMIPLLRSPDALTRTRAFLVLQGVASRYLAGREWQAFLGEMGNYDPAGPQPEREQAVLRWQAWVDALLLHDRGKAQ